MILGKGLGILGAPGIVFLLIFGAILDAFRKHFGSLGGVLDDIGASLSFMGGPWGPLGAPRVDFHGFWEPFWRSLGG